MRRAELVEQVRRLADQTAYLAAEVRRDDVAVQLLGQVRDFGHRLPPGLAADIRRVVDDMVAARRHEAQAGPHSPAAGTSSAGDGAGSASPAAPSTETRQAAQDGQSGSDGGAMDGVPAHQAQGGDVPHTGAAGYRDGEGQPSAGGSASPPGVSVDQPTPQVGDEWEGTLGDRIRITAPRFGYEWWAEVIGGVRRTPVTFRRGHSWRLVERDGKPWPPAQEPESVAVEPATDERPEVVPADDDDLAVVEDTNVPVRHQFDWNNWFVACLVARLRQEQLFSSRMEYERDVAVHRREQAERERDEAVARAEKAEQERDGAMYRVMRHAEKYEAERDEAVARAEFSEVERDEAVERAKAAEDYYLMKLRAVKERAETWEKRWERQTEALARVERVTYLEGAVVQAAEDLVTADVEDHEALLMALDRAVAAMQRVRDAQAVDQ